jgi:hypothetical protein
MLCALSRGAGAGDFAHRRDARALPRARELKQTALQRRDSSEISQCRKAPGSSSRATGMGGFRVSCFVFRVSCFVFRVSCFVFRVDGVVSYLGHRVHLRHERPLRRTVLGLFEQRVPSKNKC